MRDPLPLPKGALGAPNPLCPPLPRFSSCAGIRFVVFVGNLAWQASWQDLKDHFRTVGEVTHAEVILVPGTTRSKGCGHVTFANASDAATAISTLNDTVICHRMIFVREVIYNDNGTEILCRLSGDGRTATA